MEDRPPIDDTIEWLSTRYDAARIIHHEQIPGRDGETASVSVPASVTTALRAHGITDLYRHQVEAIQAVRDGENVVIATPTASGKSLTYTLPALERGLDDGVTLYIAPYRALINDQHDTLQSYTDALAGEDTVAVAAQTGQTSSDARREIKASQPDVLLTTIDQLHLSMLPYAHHKRHWRWLFERLETIVLDEIHMYRGYFGSHTALVLRRLNRLVDHYNGSPEFICCSATIGNPVEHASVIADQPAASFQLVDEDASAAGDRHYLLWNPPLKHPSDEPTAVTTPAGDSSGLISAVKQRLSPTKSRETSPPAGDSSEVSRGAGGARRSNHVEANRLFCDLVQRGYQTLVFTRTRQTAERYAELADQELSGRGNHELADSVSAYHAALAGERRQALETALQDGEARGVWSTTALEIGIDIGELDAVIIDGHPGTEMSLFQQAGRAGRGEDPCLVVVVADDNPLDQYVMRDPAHLFDGGVEEAAVNPLNDAVRPDHIVCAAGDSYLAPTDEQYFGEGFPEFVQELTAAGRLTRAETNAIHWEPTNDDVHWETDIRDIGSRSVQLIDQHRGEVIGSLGFQSALRDVHPDAIYTQEKATYRVVELDLEADRAYLERVDTNAYTQALREKTVTILDVEEEGGVPFDGAVMQAGLATVEVSSETSGYLHYAYPGDDDPDEHDFSTALPSADFQTTAVVFDVPPGVESAVLSAVDGEEAYRGGLHAFEHALIAVYPRAVLCDRQDVGSLSRVSHPQTERGTVFVYDAYAGGAGFSRLAFRQLDELVRDVEGLVMGCGCASGCPSCIHSPHCGNGNRMLDKDAAVAILSVLLDR
jgi:DEAD/DEAH box helicase domain-containing protein